VGKELDGCIKGAVKVGFRDGGVCGSALGVKEKGDSALPKLGGLGGVDQVAGLLAQALLHQGHDLDLVAVEEPVADAAVLRQGVGGLGPPPGLGEGAGAVHEQGDVQLLAHRAVVLVRAGQGREADGATVDVGLVPVSGSVAEAGQQAVGEFAVAGASLQPGEVDERHQRHDGDPSAEASGVGAPTSACPTSRL
jgi:hypothetical protein